MTGDGTRLVRAAYTGEVITVYQAYGPQIASAAVAAGTFVPPFSRDRMTWIKPSPGWMMHHSGWAAKPGQERVLAIEISRAGFEWALAHSCLSHCSAGVHASPESWARYEGVVAGPHPVGSGSQRRQDRGSARPRPRRP